MAISTVVRTLLTRLRDESAWEVKHTSSDDEIALVLKDSDPELYVHMYKATETKNFVTVGYDWENTTTAVETLRLSPGENTALVKACVVWIERRAYQRDVERAKRQAAISAQLLETLNNTPHRV